MPLQGFVIRTAEPGEAVALTALCLRAKVHWGYDDDFMAAVAPLLTVHESMIRAGGVLVAVRDAGAPGAPAGRPGNPELLGMATVVAWPGRGRFELSHLFVAPEAMGRGIGRALFRAAGELARRRGARRLMILADPNAAGFYTRLGAVPAGTAPSDAVPGRRLPLFEFDLAGI